jgi:uncharacterized protein YfaS (alpha-2-macroglobulin family)
MIFMTLLKQVKKNISVNSFLAGVVINKRSGLQIAGAKVTLSDSNYKVLKEFTTDNAGGFDFGPVEGDQNTISRQKIRLLHCRKPSSYGRRGREKAESRIS